MKALTVQQPWAWAIVHGGKDVENRTTAWKHRGQLAIHAGARWSDRGAHSPLVARAFIDNLMSQGWVPPRGPDAFIVTAVEDGLLPELFADFGAITGVVNLTDVHHHAGSGARVDCCTSPWAEPWHEGSGSLVHLAVERPVALRYPVQIRGSLGLWTMPDWAELKVTAQIPPTQGDTP